MTELVAETVLHGWDLARAVAAPFTVADDVLTEAETGLALLPGEVFGPQAFAAAVTKEGTGLRGLVARSGHDPEWSP